MLITAGVTEEKLGNDDAKILATAQQIQQKITSSVSTHSNNSHDPDPIEIKKETEETIDNDFVDKNEDLKDTASTQQPAAWKQYLAGWKWNIIGSTAAFFGFAMMSIDRLDPKLQIGLALASVPLEIAAKKYLTKNKTSSTRLSLAANMLSVVNDIGFIKQNLLSDPYRYADHSDTVDVAMHAFFLINDLALCGDNLDELLASKQEVQPDSDQAKMQDQAIDATWSQENETGLQQVIHISKTYLLPGFKGLATVAMASRQDFYGINNSQLHSHQYNAERHIATAVYSLTRLIEIYQKLKPENTYKKWTIGTLLVANAIWLALKLKQHLDMNDHKVAPKADKAASCTIQKIDCLCGNKNVQAVVCGKCHNVMGCNACMEEKVNKSIAAYKNKKGGFSGNYLCDEFSCPNKSCNCIPSPEIMEKALKNADSIELAAQISFFAAYRDAVRPSEHAEPKSEAGINDKFCPKCFSPYERTEGCNHMTCENKKCKERFCHVCNAKYNGNHDGCTNCGGNLFAGGEYFMGLNAYNPIAPSHNYFWDSFNSNLRNRFGEQNPDPREDGRIDERLAPFSKGGCMGNTIKRGVGFLGRTIIPIKNLFLRRNHEMPATV